MVKLAENTGLLGFSSGGGSSGIGEVRIGKEFDAKKSKKTAEIEDLLV
jgi:hypothetical protein